MNYEKKSFFSRLFPCPKLSIRKSVWTVGFLTALTSGGCTIQKVPNVFEQILQNIVGQETEGIDIHPIDLETKKCLTLVDSIGAFTDIDYNDHAQTSWTPITHVSRLKDMVVSYISPKSQFYGDKHLHTTIVNLFNYWYDANPTSTNWWFHEIGWPQGIGLSLSLMRAGKEQVPDSTENKLLKRMKDISNGPDQPGSQGTGANKMDIALQWIYRTCLQEDKPNLDFAIQQFFYPIQFNTGEGIQSDYSYLQHGQQLYTGGYGEVVLNAFLKVAFYVQDTPYEDEQKNRLMSEFVRYGNLPFIRGKNMFFNAQGRGVARMNNSDRSKLSEGLQKFMLLDQKHKKTYEESIKRLKGTVPANYGISPLHQHFWRADYTIHQRPAYSMDVRTASTRTVRCENGNGENLLGYFITEGGTGIMCHGNEYNNIFPSWDWSHIPGTTTPSLPQVPVPEPWGDYGQSTFTGGVSDGRYGVTTYQMKDEQFNINTYAKKSWFFFDKEVVCMGSDIRSSNPHPIHTTVNQCLLHGDINVITQRNNSETKFKNGCQSIKDLICINHDSISYFFPEGGDLHVSDCIQTGSWHNLCQHLSDKAVSQSIFKVWFNHGARPTQGKYIYYVIPSTTTAQEAIETLDSLRTINTNSIQAVYNQSLNMLGVVFHDKGSFKIDNIEVSSSTPLAALFTHLHTDSVKVYVADPSYQSTHAMLSIKTPDFQEKKVINCEFPKDSLYVGSTQSYLIH